MVINNRTSDSIKDKKARLTTDVLSRRLSEEKLILPTAHSQTMRAGSGRKSDGKSPDPTADCADAGKRDAVIFGKMKSQGSQCTQRQYLLVQNSPALRTFFGGKEAFVSLANESHVELEFTRQIATLKETEWPKYQLIELRGGTPHALDAFENKLLTMNPSYSEKLVYDPEKYTFSRITSRLSSASTAAWNSDILPNDESTVSADSGAESDSETEQQQQQQTSKKVKKKRKPSFRKR